MVAFTLSIPKCNCVAARPQAIIEGYLENPNKRKKIEEQLLFTAVGVKGVSLVKVR